MKSLSAVIVAVLMNGCATEQAVTLLPRGDAKRGTGTLDRINQDLTVTIEGKTFRGKSVLQTSTSGWSLFGPTKTEYSSRSTALLIGDTGQVRCEYGWDAMMISATGVCVDYRNNTYDILIQ